MTFFEILLLAVALAMDAFSVGLVSAVKGCCSVRQILRMSLTFGFFQFLMPVLGFTLLFQFHTHIEDYDHWIAFSLLALVGGKMLWESFGGEEPKELQRDPTKGPTLILLAIATSIDALAVGASLATLQIPLWLPAFTIGFVCFVLTALGMYLSGFLVHKIPALSAYANGAGGLILLGIGIKILIEHKAFSF